MQSPGDLEIGLRSASGSDPDTERALDDVLRRVRRRQGRRPMGVLAVLILAIGIAIVVTSDSPSDDASVIVGGPLDQETPAASTDPDPAFDPTTTTTAPGPGVGDRPLEQRWTAPGVVGTLVPSGGRFILATADTVLAAEGFGTVGAPELVGRITAVDRGTGQERWRAELGESAFLQGVAGSTVIANSDQERVVGLDLADGSVRWEISLAALGLDGYGAVTSAVTEPVAAIGLTAVAEGDGRPPVVLGIAPATGDIAWTTPLVAGTSLTWGTPPVLDGETVFTSSVRDPQSTADDVAQLIDLDDGGVRWSAAMSSAPGLGDALINGGSVHLPAFPEVVTVDRTDGERRWTRTGYGSVLVAGQLWMIDDGALVTVDADTGDVVGEFESPIDEPRQLLDLGDGRVGVVSLDQFAAVDQAGSVQRRTSWSAPLADIVRLDGELLLVATQDHAVTAYSVPAASAPDPPVDEAEDAVACAPLSGDEPVLALRALASLPAGFSVDGPVETTETGPVDLGGESQAVLRLVDADDRWIEVVVFGAESLRAFIADAHQGAVPQPVTYQRCLATAAGVVSLEQGAELSVTNDRSVLAVQEWEYGGFLVVGGPGVTADELVAVGAGLRPSNG